MRTRVARVALGGRASWKGNGRRKGGEWLQEKSGVPVIYARMISGKEGAEAGTEDSQGKGLLETGVPSAHPPGSLLRN